MLEKKIFITSACRTAVGSLGKTLKNVKAEELGSAVISNAINKSNIKPSELDEIIMGQVLTGGSGQNPARQAAMKSGVPKEKPAYVVNQVCGSGIRSVASGFQSIKSRDSKILVAGGQENMSLAPHVIHLRDGKKLGDAELIDTMIKDGLWDAFNGYHMGITAENVAEKFQVTRDEQDKFALNSQEKALDLAGWTVKDVDLFEINEAFAAQSLAVIKTLSIPIEKVNVNGGAIALGHPIGASGTRILVTLIHEMIKRDVKKGLATLCIGGGMGIAMCVER